MRTYNRRGDLETRYKDGIACLKDSVLDANEKSLLTNSRKLAKMTTCVRVKEVQSGK